MHAYPKRSWDFIFNIGGDHDSCDRTRNHIFGRVRIYKLCKCTYCIFRVCLFVSFLYVTTREQLNSTLERFTKICRTFQFLLKSDNSNEHFTSRPSCISARGNDWVGNPRLPSLTGESPCNSQSAAQTRGESSVITLSPSQQAAGTPHPA
jgi:hypothetical protein